MPFLQVISAPPFPGVGAWGFTLTSALQLLIEMSEKSVEARMLSLGPSRSWSTVAPTTNS